MRPFISELGELQNKILEMGGLVETSIHSSIRSLVERDDKLMADIWEIETRINRLDIEIDEFATRLLALHQPVAKDLRFLTAAIKINSDLERMGGIWPSTSASARFPCLGDRKSSLSWIFRICREPSNPWCGEVWTPLSSAMSRWRRASCWLTMKWMS
jgi:hypothetical protein